MPSSSENESLESRPTAKAGSAPRLTLFALTIFVSAFLLFQVQPLIAKLILPWFGGSAAVWTTCMLFFQIALLLGYGYAHRTTQSLKPSRQSALHIVLLTLSLLCLPILPNEWWKPAGGDDPLLRILGLLAATIGLPYLLLSATSPLLQAWLARTRRGAVPYRLFALSNAGSMLALLGYPVLVEPYFTNGQQAWAWSTGFAFFAILCGVVAFRCRSGERIQPEVVAATSAPGWKMNLLWMALAAAASALLIAVTNHLSQNVASIPFLWIVPLALYLFSFILCFERSAWYRRAIFLPLFVVALGTMSAALGGVLADVHFRMIITILSACLFVCCMVCHGEVARLKPAPEHLTGFYLMVSVGGAAGGLFVAFIAPRVFHALYEFPISLVFCAAAVLIVYFREQPIELVVHSPRQITWLICVGLTGAMAVYLAQETRNHTVGARVLVRNFYGALRVSDRPKTDSLDAYRELMHGTINHGDQFLDIARRREPTTYYTPSSGIGRTIQTLQQLQGPMKVGIVGLGTGTIAAYGRWGDTYRYYEINPLVIEIAHQEFFYLADTKAKVEIALGDARLSLERETRQDFDVLAVDAFSSDSIPIHLLTREAFVLYWRHIKPNGVLAVHVSNRYLDLAPVVDQEAKAIGKPAKMVDSESDEALDAAAATWVLITSRPSFFDSILLQTAAVPVPASPGIRIWTDDYSNLWQILK